MKSSRLQKLKRVERGDVIYGVDSGARGKLLLVIKATKTRIVTRHVTSQRKFEFGRNGRFRKVRGGGKVTIISTRPLPPTEYGIVLGLDRKMRLGQLPDGFMLSKDEVRVILKSGEYFMARPLIDGEEPREFPAEGARPAAFD
jgi:hypothetical protein